MGICGTAMGSLAGLLKTMGFRVTGSDVNVYPPMSTQLQKLGITIQQGYKRENLTPRPDAVIVGNVMTRKHEEVIALLETDIPYTSLPKAMGEVVIGSRNSVVICGTHGKTTTTALMSWVAETAGVKPGFLIGGVPLNFDMSFKVPEGDFFVIEGDEYDTAFFDKVPKFIHYRPKYVVLTSIEFDHADIYPDLNSVKNAFSKLIELIPSNGILLYKHGDQNIASILGPLKGEKYSYGLFGSGADYEAKILGHTTQHTKFEVYKKRQLQSTVEVGLFGDYNIENALADFALAHEIGWPIDKILKGMKSFKGVKRRQEIVGEKNGVTIIDDFAHHPTAVKLTVENIQNRFKGQRVISVFEPRSATSRRKVFQNDYREAFKVCQKLILSDVFNKGGLGADQELDVGKIVNELKASGHDADLIQGVEAIEAKIRETAKPGDVVLIMSNGAFGGLHSNLMK
jgi:UDP-N-acetylmuramate: L-alanyl-gamma-D-glutamyl-meso-diaminopimelate ligase